MAYRAVTTIVNASVGPLMIWPDLEKPALHVQVPTPALTAAVPVWYPAHRKGAKG